MPTTSQPPDAKTNPPNIIHNITLKTTQLRNSQRAISRLGRRLQCRQTVCRDSGIHLTATNNVHDDDDFQSYTTDGRLKRAKSGAANSQHRFT